MLAKGATDDAYINIITDAGNGLSPVRRQAIA